MFPQTEKNEKSRLICYREQTRGNDVLFISSCHVECACQLVRRDRKEHISDNVSKREEDMVRAGEEVKRKIHYREEEVEDCGCIYG